MAMEVLVSGLILDSLRKYFCACVRIWTTVRVGMSCAMRFHCLPYLRRPSSNMSCSSCVQRPTISRPWGSSPWPSSGSYMFTLFGRRIRAPLPAMPCAGPDVHLLLCQDGTQPSPHVSRERGHGVSPGLARPRPPQARVAPGRSEHMGVERDTDDSNPLALASPFAHCFAHTNGAPPPYLPKPGPHLQNTHDLRGPGDGTILLIEAPPSLLPCPKSRWTQARCSPGKERGPVFGASLQGLN
jgi:hypothetical protein